MFNIIVIDDKKILTTLLFFLIISDLNNLKARCKEELGHYEEHFLRLVDCEQTLLLSLKTI